MISGSSRSKRSTDLLNDEAKARIVGRDRCPSGSEHSAQNDDDDVLGASSSSLSDPFFGFGIDKPPEIGDSDCDSRDRSICEPNCTIIGLIEQVLLDEGDEFKKTVTGHILRAAEIFSCLRSNPQIMRSNVMGYLRNHGYNAGICKTKWKGSGGLSGGGHEFIDVVVVESSTRYFVELDFPAEFQIARPTEAYEKLLHLLPRVFVGTCRDLKEVLKLVSQSARQSLKSGGLHLPPWRKHRFLQNKWFETYRRTTNPFPASFPSPSAANSSYGCKCRVVGFSSAVNGGRLLFPAFAQTR